MVSTTALGVNRQMDNIEKAIIAVLGSFGLTVGLATLEIAILGTAGTTMNHLLPLEPQLYVSSYHNHLDDRNNNPNQNPCKDNQLIIKEVKNCNA